MIHPRLFRPLTFGFIFIFFAGFSFNKVTGQTYPPFSITAYDPGSAGYYFLCPFKVGANPNNIVPTHMILDAKGDVVYYKVFPNVNNVGDFKLQPNGLISYSSQGKFYLMDGSFYVIDSISSQNGTAFTPDFQILSNGHFLFLGNETIQMDLSSYNLFGVNHTLPGSATATVICGIIRELDPGRNLVFEWHSKDYFSFTDVDIDFLINPNNVDWTHFNAIEQDDDGNILVCSRHFNEVTKINRSDSSIIWRMGGNANQFTFLNDTAMFKRQHDIRKLSNGNYSIFDNGDGNLSNPFHTAAGKEYHIDDSLLTVDLVWSYINNPAAYSKAMGCFGRKPNGISMVNYGLNSNDDKAFTSVNDAGNKLLEIAFSDSLWSFRSFHYDSLPWNLNRPLITCFENNGQFYLDAGPGHSQYIWSNGASTQTVLISTLDTFVVFVPKGDDGFISSEKIIIDNLLNPCHNVSSDETNFYSFSVYPNPVTDKLIVEFNFPELISELLKVTDINGKNIEVIRVDGNKRISIETSGLSPGIYLVNCSGTIQKFVRL